MLFILLSVLLFSYNNVLWKKNLTSISIPFLVSYRSFFTSSVSLLILFVFFDFEAITHITFMKITAGSIFGVIGLFSMLSVIRKVSLQWLGVYNLIGVTFTVLYLWLFETIEIQKSLLGLFVIVLGFISYMHANKESHLKITIKHHLLLLLMTFSFSCSAILHWKNLTANVPPLLIIANQEFLVFLVGVFLTFKKGSGTLYKSQLKSYFSRVVLMSLVIFTAILLNFLGLKQTSPIITSLLFLAIPLTTIVFGALFFKEKISFKNVLSISIIVMGAFILHYQST